ncbi:MAG: DEAD/DEAH box helicase family protein, partial [Kiritimatiellae bacterium]|nr:DEAD/DEAH box helicase family protein [Kiritimatiellia bacterium]
GKTLTSFKCAQLVSESGHADKVVFLLNRIELGNQTYEAFRNFADDATDVQQTENTAILFGKLKSNAGADSLIVTSIQKMSRIREDPATAHDLATVRRKRIVFVVDECHADTFGEMLLTIKETFPAAIFFGFSGTPILEENEKKGFSTADIFGNELHRYSIADGIRDANVLGFDPNKVLTFPDAGVRKAVALEKARAKTEEEALADEAKRRIYQKYMALPMAGSRRADGTRESGIEDFVPESQYRSEEHRGKVVEHIRDNWARLSILGKFHAILATSSIPEAFEYYQLLKREMPNLKATVVVDDSIDNDGGGAAKEDELVKVLDDYNARYGKKFTLKTFAGFKRDVAARLAHKKPYRDIGLPGGEAARLDLVIVVNQMLTGYDSKWVNTLYLDKTLEYARVIQSFSRTNRLFGPDKPFGTILYYRRPHTMEKNIEDAIKLYSGDRPLGVFVNRLGDHLERLDALFAEIRDIFRRAGVPDLSRLPEAEEERALFARRFNELSSELSAARVQGFRWDVRDYAVGDGEDKSGYTVGFDETEYLALLQRYKELAGGDGGGGGGGGDETPPFDIRPTLVEIDTGMVDSNYMDAKFGKFLRALADGEDATQILADLHRSFATLSQEDQKFAQQVLDDVQNGRLAPDPGKTLSDYITAYEKRAKDDRIHRFAAAFGADEAALRALTDAQPPAGELNAYGRFDALLATVDPAKAAAFFSALEGHPVSPFQANLMTDRYFRKFIAAGGFPVPGGLPSAAAGDADECEYAEAAGKEDSRESDGDGYRAI